MRRRYIKEVGRYFAVPCDLVSKCTATSSLCWLSGIEKQSSQTPFQWRQVSDRQLKHLNTVPGKNTEASKHFQPSSVVIIDCQCGCWVAEVQVSPPDRHSDQVWVLLELVGLHVWLKACHKKVTGLGRFRPQASRGWSVWMLKLSFPELYPFLNVIFLVIQHQVLSIHLIDLVHCFSAMHK